LVIGYVLNADRCPKREHEHFRKELLDDQVWKVQFWFLPVSSDGHAFGQKSHQNKNPLGNDCNQFYFFIGVGLFISFLA